MDGEWELRVLLEGAGERAFNARATFVVTVCVFPLKTPISSAVVSVGRKMSFATAGGMPLDVSKKTFCALANSRCTIGYKNSKSKRHSYSEQNTHKEFNGSTTMRSSLLEQLAGRFEFK